MKRVFIILLTLSLLLLLLSACSENSSPKLPGNTTSGEQESITANDNNSKNDADDGETNSDGIKAKALGGLSPADALEYMKKTPDIVIVQVNTAEWKITPGFTGALWIPHDEMAERYNEIPKGVPVILHCGAGVVSVPAYEILLEKRPDIPEISYIAGSPHSIIEAYNEWLANQGD